jgi:DNA-binding CsgD family transcriptional regulator
LVTSHLRRIYGKLHLRSRTQAALKFLGQRKSPP